MSRCYIVFSKQNDMEYRAQRGCQHGARWPVKVGWWERKENPGTLLLCWTKEMASYAGIYDNIINK
jgi:hypothetical protein